MQQFILEYPGEEADPMRPWAMEKAPEPSQEEAQPSHVCGFALCPMAMLATEEL